MTCVTRRILIAAAILVSGVCARAADDAVLQLKRIHQAQSAGCYYALERSFHQEEGRSVPLVYTGRTAVGSMDPATWVSMHDMLVRYGILERALNVSAAYDLGPLTAVLGGERR